MILPLQMATLGGLQRRQKYSKKTKCLELRVPGVTGAGGNSKVSIKIKIISTRAKVEVKIRRPKWQQFISY
jgi:hypothetical protein